MYKHTDGGAEIASTGKCRYGNVKYKVAKCVWVENTSTENSSTATQGWKTQVWKIKVRVSRVGKCKYGKIEYGITVQLLETPYLFLDKTMFSCLLYSTDTQDKGIVRDVFKETAGTWHLIFNHLESWQTTRMDL